LAETRAGPAQSGAQHPPSRTRTRGEAAPKRFTQPLQGAVEGLTVN